MSFGLLGEPVALVDANLVVVTTRWCPGGEQSDPPGRRDFGLTRGSLSLTADANRRRLAVGDVE
jgi:hypothetical protein